MEVPRQSTASICRALVLKAAADFGADLRNHDPARTWEQGYVEN
jgi:hypothetical protein